MRQQFRESSFNNLEDPDGEVPFASAAQHVCGLLFTELWSDGPLGFPMPRGCSYTPAYQDADGFTAPWRELHMVRSSSETRLLSTKAAKPDHPNQTPGSACT